MRRSEKLLSPMLALHAARIREWSPAGSRASAPARAGTCPGPRSALTASRPRRGRAACKSALPGSMLHVADRVEHACSRGCEDSRFSSTARVASSGAPRRHDLGAAASRPRSACGISSGGCSKSASITITARPRAWRSPARSAAWWPKLRVNEMIAGSPGRRGRGADRGQACRRSNRRRRR